MKAQVLVKVNAAAAGPNCLPISRLSSIQLAICRQCVCVCVQFVSVCLPRLDDGGSAVICREKDDEEMLSRSLLMRKADPKIAIHLMQAG